MRGSYGIDYKERIKVMKLLWDAIGTEFGGRHELYERNYAGNHEDIRIQALWNARSAGTLEQMTALAEQCMSEYDENGWTDPAWLDPDDVAYPGLPEAARSTGVRAPGSEIAKGTIAMNWIDQRPDDAMDGAFTAVAPGPVASVEPSMFRDAMAASAPRSIS